MEKSQTENLKPLDEYLEGLKSRNSKFASVLPDFQKTFQNVASYDDLYKKLIEESYYICSELVKGKVPQAPKGRTRNGPSIAEKEELSNNINRALIFQSNENINNQGENKKESLLSPINKIPNDNKSYFYSTNRFYNTDVKDKTEFQNNIYFSTQPNNQSFNKTLRHNKSKYSSNNLNKEMANSDILLLINNAKEIEKMIEKEDPINKIENFENKITDNLLKLDELRKNEINLVENKILIEKKLSDVGMLCKQFEEKFNKLETYLEIVKNSNCNTNRSQNEKFVENNNTQRNKEDPAINNISNLNYHPQIQPSSSRENKENNTFFNSGNPANNQTNNHLNYNSNNNSNNNANPYTQRYFLPEQENVNDNQHLSQNYSDCELESKFHIKKTPREYAKKINHMLANNNIKDATEIWRTFNYDFLEGSSYERSYEMLVYILKHKDREMDSISKKTNKFEQLSLQAKKKDFEIIELFTQLEIYKNKLKDYESMSEQYIDIKKKLANIEKDNTILYRENLKLKTLKQQDNYLSKRTPTNFI
jgi:hypothetical protein